MAAPGILRSIGGFTANITIEEDSTDELMITRHPVEQGADITDHAYKQPAELVVRAGWTNSSLSALGNEDYCSSIYAQLLTLQESRAPFSVQTGQRLYTNMLMRAIRKVTNEDTEYALIAEISLQQIVIVPIEVSSVPPTANQSQPQQTAATTQSGVKTLQPAPNFNVPTGPL